VRLGAALLLVALSPGCRGARGRGDAGPREPFIAFAPDFQGFRGWKRTDLGRFSAGGHLEGVHQYAYENHPRRAGSRTWDVGAIIVRTLERGTPETWQVFASVKRGGGYNARGNVGWEHFRLRLDPNGQVIVVARGLNPGTGLSDPYAAGEGVGCNTCHGSRDARVYDGVLSPALRPADP
jgi:hypothetical protein